MVTTRFDERFKKNKIKTENVKKKFFSFFEIYKREKKNIIAK